MSYGQYVYLLIYFSIDMDALRAIILKSAFVNRYVSIRQTAYKTDHLIIITEAGVPEFC